MLEHGRLAEDVNGGADVQVPAGELLCVALVCTVELLHVVLCVLDNYLMRLAIQAEHHCNRILFAVLRPPRSELQALDLICSARDRQATG